MDVRWIRSLAYAVPKCVGELFAHDSNVMHCGLGTSGCAIFQRHGPRMNGGGRLCPVFVHFRAKKRESGQAQVIFGDAAGRRAAPAHVADVARGPISPPCARLAVGKGGVLERLAPALSTSL